MGFAIELFVQHPNEELICAICRDVFDRPRSCQPCGHTFCKECLMQWEEYNCPTCREEFDYDDCYHNKTLQRMIHKLEVRCRNNKNEEYRDTDNISRRRRSPCSNGNDNGNSQKRQKIDERNYFCRPCSPTSCDWTGCLGDWQNKHKDECALEKIQCVVPGCKFECLRKDLDDHLDKGSGRVEHLRLLIKEETTKIRDELREELEHAKEALEDEYKRQQTKTKWVEGALEATGVLLSEYVLPVVQVGIALGSALGLGYCAYERPST